MKRIISLLAAMAIMAAMLVAMAMPAFAFAANGEKSSCVSGVVYNFGGSQVASFAQSGESPGGKIPELAHNKQGECGLG